ncbi:hypothetical protein PG996_008318 [Apiospora saccharicola]|uniref:Uncharacterized protein n=1 Tax=Apiospora saccharicola TaxID=335842 RepID=A0ABR1V039_9PEZI
MAIVIIDDVGDLIVKIPVEGKPNTEQKYRVCKRAMQRLYVSGVKNEAFSNPGPIVEIKTAHSIGIVTLAFTIAHTPFCQVPEQLDEMDLFKLLKFTSELDITHILRPFAKNWATAINLSEDGGSIVDTIVDDIMSTRIEAIQAIYKLIGDTMAALATEGQSTPECRRLCRHKEGHDLCEIIMVGGLHQLLFEHRLWPPMEHRPKSDRQMKSVRDLAEKIEGIGDSLNDNDLRHYIRDLKHPKCAKFLPLFVNLDATLEEISVLSLRHFDGHLTKQGELTGFVPVPPIVVVD